MVGTTEEKMHGVTFRKSDDIPNADKIKKADVVEVERHLLQQRADTGYSEGVNLSGGGMSLDLLSTFKKVFKKHAPEDSHISVTIYEKPEENRFSYVMESLTMHRIQESLKGHARGLATPKGSSSMPVESGDHY